MDTEDVQEPSDEINLEAKMQDACERRERLGLRLDIFRINVERSKDESHKLVAGLLDEVNLLKRYKTDSEIQSEPGMEDAASKAASIVPNEEELFKERTRAELMGLSLAHDEA